MKEMYVQDQNIPKNIDSNLKTTSMVDLSKNYMYIYISCCQQQVLASIF